MKIETLDQRSWKIIFPETSLQLLLESELGVWEPLM